MPSSEGQRSHCPRPRSRPQSIRRVLQGPSSLPVRSPTRTRRRIMNPNMCSLFVPRANLLGSESQEAVRTGSIGASHRRFWRGSAARSAGVDVPLGVAARRAQRNLPELDGRRWHLRGMGGRTDHPSFFTERSLAAFLAVSDRTVRKWIRRGDLPSYKLGASRRIDPADVEDFLARHRDEAA